MKQTRRNWLKLSIFSTLVGYFSLRFPVKLFAKNAEESDVILIRNKDVLKDSGNPDKGILSDMIDKALTTLTGIKDPSDAWKSIIKPDDIVGIKSNVWSNLHTPKALEEILKERVMESGVRKDNISVNDRGILRDPVF